MRIEPITTTEGLEALRPEWSRLFAQCPDATPFQSPEWLLPWWRHLGGGELFVLALRDKAHLVGVAPLFFHEWQGRRQVSPIGVSQSDYFDLLLLPEYVSEGVQIVFDALVQAQSRWDICILPEVREGSPLLNASTTGHWSLTIEPTETCPVLNLPSSADEFASGLAAHHRRNLRRAQRLLDEMGGGQIELADANTVREFMEALFRLHTARWSQENEPGVLGAASVREFHCQVAWEFLRSNMLRLYGLRRNGTIASVMYDFASHNRVFAYLGGFEPELDRASPGTLLTFNAIRQAVQAGCREYDFMRGAEYHKYIWGARDHQNFRLVLTRP